MARSDIGTSFWDKVKIGQPDECWEWQKFRQPRGYGIVRMDGKCQLAHRVAWTLTKGEIPKDMLACHHCDNPSCCNPNHLFLGTHLDNATDKERKGRGNQPKGERSGNHKLTDKQVFEIRRLRAQGWKSVQLAKRFGVVHQLICAICLGRSWKHLPLQP
jgi:hypothetical protein